MAPSSSGSGYLVLIQKIAGSNPAARPSFPKHKEAASPKGGFFAFSAGARGQSLESTGRKRLYFSAPPPRKPLLTAYVPSEELRASG